MFRSTKSNPPCVCILSTLSFHKMSSSLSGTSRVILFPPEFRHIPNTILRLDTILARATNLTNQRAACCDNLLSGGGIVSEYGWEVKQSELYTPKQQGPEQRRPAVYCCKISCRSLKEK